jgi:tRNA threonylcarbamoyladenosine biosynthesis protein TsaE
VAPAERSVAAAREPSFGYARVTMTVATDHERRFTSADPAATTALGQALAGAARPGDVVCLWGDLGAGKTHLAKAFGAGLGVTATITSPSFILMAEYEGRLPLFHIDLYRLADATDALSGGLIDDRQSAGVTLIEWPDRLGEALPAERLDVVIDGAGEEPRSIVVRAYGDRPQRYLAVVP